MRRVLPPVEPKAVGPNQPRSLLLYVEDDEENWEVAEYRLSAAYEMVRARNAAEACERLRKHAAALHGILMDIELRGSDLNGIELTELFRGKRGRALPAYARDLPTVTRPIVFVTAHGARYTDVELMLLGADSVIAKPVDFPALAAVLDAATKRLGARG